MNEPSKLKCYQTNTLLGSGTYADVYRAQYPLGKYDLLEKFIIGG